MAGPYEIRSASSIIIPAPAIILTGRKMRGFMIVGTQTHLVLHSTSLDSLLKFRLVFLGKVRGLVSFRFPRFNIPMFCSIEI